MMKRSALLFSGIANLPTSFGDFRIMAITDASGREHAVIFKGDIRERENVPVRIHSECLTGDAFGSLKCDCQDQLQYSQEYIANLGFGIIIYLRQEGRGIGLFNKVNAYRLQDEGLDTIEANHQLGLENDLRDFSIAAEILKELSVYSVCLMTNNTEKIKDLEASGMKVTRRIPVLAVPNEYNHRYLSTKKKILNHLL